MEKIVDKISSYNILNNILPGAVFCFMLNNLLSINILQDGIIDKVFIYYFIGMIISRIGSVIIEPICKKTKFITFEPYNDFVRASSKDDKINVLSETNNTYRTMLSVCLILLLTKLYLYIVSEFSWLANFNTVLIVTCLTILFAFSYKKQTGYVRSRVIQNKT